MDYTTTSPLWDFPQSPSAFPQLAENDFLAILQQFNADPPSTNAFTIPHDGVDPSKITNLPAPAPPTPLSDESSPSPPSVNDHESTSRRQSTTSTGELEAHELKRKASTDGLEDDSPESKSCVSRSPYIPTPPIDPLCFQQGKRLPVGSLPASLVR
jgi:AP-1-like transcription factor